MKAALFITAAAVVRPEPIIQTLSENSHVIRFGKEGEIAVSVDTSYLIALHQALRTYLADGGAQPKPIEPASTSAKL